VFDSLTTATVAIAGAAYIVAALLFILSLGGLSKHETARTGIVYGMVGMAIALVATGVLVTQRSDWLGIVLLLVAVAIGGSIGLWRAARVQMTGMPQFIACCTPSWVSRPC
jgi:NAD/NADP transhydrogenase beta subunit